MKRLALAFLLLGCVVTAQQAPVSPKPADAPYFTDAFPPEEFAARRARGHGADRRRGRDHPGRPRDVGRGRLPAEQPVLLPHRRRGAAGDSRSSTASTKQSTLYPAGRRARERYNGPELGPGDEAARITGIDAVVARDSVRGGGRRSSDRTDASSTRRFAPRYVAAALAARRRRTPRLRPAIRGTAGRRARRRSSQKLKASAPAIAIKDLDPILDAMRFIKSAREIAVMREVTRITGLGIMEAMREAAPGDSNTS